jgi:hypothetical protein
MSAHSIALRVYRLLLWCYPRRFRREYRDDLEQAFRDELGERGLIRGGGRVLADLLVSVPRQNLEAAMVRRTSFSALSRLVIAGGGALVMFAFGGVFALLALIVIAVATFAYWRGRIPWRDALGDASSSWWRYLLAGAFLLGSIAVATTYGPDFDWFPWGGLVALFLLAWGFVSLGALLAIVTMAKVIHRRSARVG